MKVTVVGFWGGFPQANGASSGYLLQDKNFNLLIDCGSAVLSKVQQYINIMEIDAVILSHYHHDHVADIGPLQYGRMIHTMLGKGNAELPIYGHASDDEEFKRLTRLPYTKGYAYNPEQDLKLGPFSIQFLKTKHPVICYAMRITNGEKTIVYTADSSFLPEFIDFSVNADLLICECNLYSGQDGAGSGHMTSTEAGKIAKRANVGKLLLTHLPYYGDHRNLVEQAKVIYDGPIELAQEGWTY